MKVFAVKTTILSSLLLLSGCGHSDQNEEKKALEKPVTETFSLGKDILSTSVSIPAELSGFQYVDLYAKVSSYVKDLKVDIGSKVKKGDLLVELEAPEISSQLAAAESGLLSQEALYTASNSTYNRLFETSKIEGTVSKNDLEQALAQKNSDFAKFQAAKATYKEMQIMQSYLQIHAPFDGVVTARNVNTGAYVGPTGTGSQSPLLTVQDYKKLRLVVSVPGSYAAYLKQGDAINFTVNSLPNHNFESKIARMSGALDTKLRSERVEMDIVNNKVLLPGMIAEAVLPLNTKDSTFVVPESAVVTYSEGTFVIQNRGGKAHRINVKKGRTQGERVEVFSDSLKVNDELIKLASEEIREGMTLKLSAK
ncbi:efflux RND transporter periplasmic adaptor subunit [Marinilongibacter aquaticus]|uniref:efflux RND transporter periplasmic adaptor subunit n=1 Tax=Marinilongibacter aquaticus TaxID=2975157 RepID=UPI0021BD4040|nr:efflux RND transporter periplasmic adaptor subunit [Marinilongibacter aquaticus]UBM59396.1 efflux RND transporter periplasmic adaptor subunit [Marinilongibacter aquaticus]